MTQQITDPTECTNDTRPKNLLVVDPCYSTRTGHNHAFNSLIVRSCQIRGLACTVLANAAFGVANHALPVFRQGIYGLTTANSLDALRVSYLLAASFAEDLSRHVTPLLRTNSTVLLHTANSPLLLGFAQWSQSLPTGAGVHLRLGFNLPPDFRERRQEITELNACLYRVALFLLRARFPDTRCYAETEELRQIFSSLGAPCPVHRRLPTAIPETSSPRDEKLEATPLICYVPGECRDEKGHDFLIRSLVSLAQSPPPWLSHLRFRFSTTAMPESVATFLRSRQDIFEVVPDTSLNNDDYWRLLSQADVVYCGYDPLEYSSRASGIFHEALALGRPVIVSHHTSMGNELARRGMPFGVPITFGDPASLSDAFAYFAHNRRTITAAAASIAPTFKEDLDPDSFLDWIM